MSVNDSSNISRTNWAALEAMTDEDIDYSDMPPLTDEFFDRATLRIPAAQAHNLIQLDAEEPLFFVYSSKDFIIIRIFFNKNSQSK
ncbi:hypothetical protein BCD67_22330 [Oscillatoriales cyanobacterium USR001]|nr:hypothetical protein BCD67_22330 [Oscillatoriales cyanobacterium USR001]